MEAATLLKRGAHEAGLDLPKQENIKRPKIHASGSSKDPITSSVERADPTDILNLLNLSIGDPVTPGSADTRFMNIAQSLLHEHRIVWRGAASGAREEYEILELEFYLNSEEHPDPYTHGSEEQTTLGQWYFHRAPRKTPIPKAAAGLKPAGYRGGTRKGLDITLGCPSSLSGTNMRGGILMRTIRRISDQRIISGPSLLVDEILRVSGATGLKDLVETHWLGDISIGSHSSGAKSWLNLERVEKPKSLGTIYNSPRIGLDLSHPSVQIDKTNPRLRFVCAHYRYYMHPELLIANGRGQTFLGVILLTPKMLDCSLDAFVLNVSDRVGMQQATAVKYLNIYRAARETGSLSGFIGSVGKGAGSSAVPFLGMAGAVRRYLDLEEPVSGHGEEVKPRLNIGTYAYAKTVHA
ncbi:hypothetical protein PENSPDRAFT_640094 [Peniophora sp. CONT]|nr:hypothetical protein PENSPDRAFT_640094 [Peniophora sp. CONT]